jgi:hypothetical protein
VPDTDFRKQADKRRIKLLYIGLVMWIVVFLNAVVRYGSRVPYQVFVLGSVIDFIMIIAFILGLRKAYRRLGSESERKSVEPK